MSKSVSWHGVILKLFNFKLVATHPRKQRVETVDLLSLSHVGVVLSDALQGQLLHQVDLIRLLQMLALEETFTRSLNQIYVSLHNSAAVRVLTMNFCTLMGKVAE